MSSSTSASQNSKSTNAGPQIKTATAVGIGIGLGLGVVFLAALAFYLRSWCMRNSKKQRFPVGQMAELGSRDGDEERSVAKKDVVRTHISELYTQPPELDGSEYLHHRPAPVPGVESNRMEGIGIAVYR
jgi:hypothetical protein